VLYATKKTTKKISKTYVCVYVCVCMCVCVCVCVLRFGEIALFSNTRRTATIAAIEDVTTLSLSCELFKTFLTCAPEIVHIFRVLISTRTAEVRCSFLVYVLYMLLLLYYYCYYYYCYVVVFCIQ